MQGIVAYAAYLPRHRLARADLAAAHGGAGGAGGRVVASYDEDATTLAVEAARAARESGVAARSLYFATTTPPYLEKTNAATIHGALDLGPDGFAADVVGSARSSVAALRAASATGGLAVMSDVRVGLPGSGEERDGADGAAAFLFGPRERAAAVPVSEVSLTADFLDRWRLPGETASHEWEERFGLDAYLPLITEAARRALREADVEQPDHVVISCANRRAAAAASAQLAARRSDARDLALGYAGAADPGLRLAAALDRARPAESILCVVAADGADAMVLRVGEAVSAARRGQPVAEQHAAGTDVGYTSYLTWRGLLARQPPRRPEPDRPASPSAARAQAWKDALVGCACEVCGQVHLPPRRVCVGCGAVDRMARRPLADQPGTIATFTIDRLAFSPSPPTIDGVIDFDGGGRYALQVTDTAAQDIAIGTRVRPTFRRLYTAGSVHNYFWKARPC